MFQTNEDAFVFDVETFFIIKIRQGIKSEVFVYDAQIEIELIGRVFLFFKIQRVVGVQKKKGEPPFLLLQAFEGSAGISVERVERSFERNFYRIEKIGDMLGNFPVEFEIQYLLWFKVAVEKGKGYFSCFISRFDRLVEKNPVRKNLDDGDMELHSVVTNPHWNRKNVAGWTGAFPAARNGFVLDGMGQDVKQYKNIGLRDVGQIFQGNRIVRKAGRKIDRNGPDPADGLQVPDHRFLEQPIFRTVQRPDQNADFLCIFQPNRRVYRVVKNDLGSRAPGDGQQKEKKNRSQDPEETRHFHLMCWCS